MNGAVQRGGRTQVNIEGAVLFGESGAHFLLFLLQLLLRILGVRGGGEGRGGGERGGE